MRNYDNASNRSHSSLSIVIAAIARLSQTVGVAVVTVAGCVGLTWVSFGAGSPGPEDPPNSGIIVRTEVTALWIPQAIHDVAQSEAGATVFHCPEALQTELERRGLNDAWYALTYRGYQVNGDSAEITQVRRISEAPDHLEEFQDMMATAAGHPPRHEGREFSQVKVGIIPDTLLTANPLKAVSQLVPEGAFFPNKRPGHELGDGRED
jgi:hypothetical protein